MTKINSQELVSRALAGAITQATGASVLGVSLRQFQRYIHQARDGGTSLGYDRNKLEKIVSNKRIRETLPKAEKEQRRIEGLKIGLSSSYPCDDCGLEFFSRDFKIAYTSGKAPSGLQFRTKGNLGVFFCPCGYPICDQNFDEEINWEKARDGEVLPLPDKKIPDYQTALAKKEPVRNPATDGTWIYDFFGWLEKKRDKKTSDPAEKNKAIHRPVNTSPVPREAAVLPHPEISPDQEDDSINPWAGHLPKKS